jgi:hypothetical protein
VPTLTTLNAASPLDADDASRLLFTIDANTTEVLSRDLDNVDTDFVSMDSGLTWTVQERENTTGGDDTVVYSIAIRDSGGTVVLAGASATYASRFQQVVGVHAQHTTDTNRGPTAFTYVNTSATKATWDAAVVDIQVVHTKDKGPDGMRAEVDIVSFDGTYTAVAPVEVTGAAETAVDTTGSSPLQTHTADATAQSAVSASGTLTQSHVVAASAQAVTAASGVLTRVLSAGGSAVAVVVTAGTVAQTQMVAGDAQTVATVAGTVTQTAVLTAAATAVVGTSGVLTSSQIVAATATAVVSASGTVTQTQHLASSATVVVAVVGTVQVIGGDLVGSATVAVAASGTLTLPDAAVSFVGWGVPVGV